MLIKSRYLVRPMTEADIDQVADIEAESFPTTWPRTAYRRELQNRYARYLVVVDRTHEPVEPAQPRRGIFSILRREEEPRPPNEYVVGYVGLWLMVDEAHVVAIAVRESYRRQGIGELLLMEAVEVAIESRQEHVTLEVRRTNVAAQSLYEKYRFLKVGVRRRYYSDNGEDAIIMSTPPILDDSYLSYRTWLREEYEKRWSAS